jgi:hypothetical protein
MNLNILSLAETRVFSHRLSFVDAGKIFREHVQFLSSRDKLLRILAGKRARPGQTARIIKPR